MAPPWSVKRSSETGFLPAEQSLGNIGWHYAERLLLSASGVKEKALQRLGGKPFVAVMQATYLWEGDDLAGIRWMNRTWFRAVLLKRQVRSGSMVVVKIR